MDGIKDILKFQLISSSGNHGNTGSAGNTGNNMIKGIWGFVALMMIEELFKLFPVLFGIVRTLFETRTRDTLQRLDYAPVKTRSITMEYIVDSKNPTGDELAEAVLRHITTSSGVTDLRYVIGRYLVNFNASFSVAPGIQCQIIHVNVDPVKNELNTKLKLFSETKTTTELRAFVDACHASYKIEQKNKLGDKLYMFDQGVSSAGKLVYNPSGSPTSSPRLQFTKHVFVTARTLDNIYFEQRDAVKARVAFFLQHPEWYAAKGVPHTLGLLLHGVPGSG